MGRRLTAAERAARQIPERELQRQICELASICGWRWCHFHDSRRQVTRGGRPVLVGDVDAAGWPDLVLVRPPELVVVEVKSELGSLTAKQREWLEVLGACGIETFVVRPSSFEVLQRRLTRR